MKKKLLKIFAIICTVLLITGVYFYFNIWVPHNKIRNVDWLTTAAAEEQREVAHKILCCSFGNHHDAYLVLIRHGNKKSIPYLLNGLKRFKDYELIECTHDHCVEALKKITGKDFGYEYEDWKRELKDS